MISIKNLEEFIQELTLPNEDVKEDNLKNQLNVSDFSYPEYNVEFLVSFLKFNSSVMNTNHDSYSSDTKFLKTSELDSLYHTDFSNIQNENNVLKNSNKRLINIPSTRNEISYTTNTTDLKLREDSQTFTIYDENTSINDDLHFDKINKILTKKRDVLNFENEIKRPVLRKTDIPNANISKVKHSFINKICQRKSLKPYTHIKNNHDTEEIKQTLKIKSINKKNNFQQSKINHEKENLKNSYEKIKLSDIDEKPFILENQFCKKATNNDNLLTSLTTVNTISPDDPVVIDSESSNDDMLVLPSGLSECLEDKSTHKMIAELSGNLTKCMLNLDRIIDAKEEEKKKNELLCNSSPEIIDNKFEDTDLKQLISNINMKAIQKDRITDFPPGLNIFDYKKCYRYFCASHGLNLESCGFKGAKGTIFEKKLEKLSTSELKELITYGIFQCQLNTMSCKEAFLEYCFKLLSVLNDTLISYACKEIFCYYIRTYIPKNGLFCWCPPMKVILTIMLNYGVNAVDHCPIKNSLHECEKTLIKFENSCLLEKEDVTSCLNEEEFLIEDGLFKVLEVLILFLHHKCNYSQEELCDLILLLSWISLDTNLVDKHVKIKIKECTAACLEKISSSDWPNKMKYLSKELAQLGTHHCNILYITLLLPSSNRGIHLQKAVSFLAIQYLLNLENCCFVAEVTPYVILEILTINPLYYVEDYFILHSIVSLIDVCIGNYVLPHYRDALQEICKLIMETFGKIRDTFQCLEGPKVKSLIARLNNKWNTIIQSLPNDQVTIFKNSDAYYNHDIYEFENNITVKEINSE